MAADLLDPTHPVTTTVASVREDLAAVVGTPVWSMSTTETETALVDVARLEAQVAQLKLRLLAHAVRMDAGSAVGATSTATWFAHRTRTTRPAAHRATRLATRLEDAHPVVDAALAEAAINVEQASVIVDAVDALPTDLVTAETVREAEAFLLREAADHDARALRILGRRLLEVLDPDAADAEEARRLASEEAAARAAASFTMTDDGQGKCHGRFTLPSLHGSILRKHLLALAAANRHPDRRPETPTKHRWGEAFMEYLETRPHDTVPSAGGCTATVVVTMTIETLMGGLKAAGLCDGTRISAGEARRLACTAAIIPAVLGGASEPLDLGRQRRFHTKAQRIALALRDRGCIAVGCDRPPTACHAHHDDPWGRGGSTDLTTGRLLCPRHHTLAHDDRYQLKAGPHGKVTFSRRT
ncbi:MAG: DUF222 domain-containing protein [Nocardioides sp.]